MGQDTATKKDELGPKGHSYSCISRSAVPAAAAGWWGGGGGGASARARARVAYSGPHPDIIFRGCFFKRRKGGRLLFHPNKLLRGATLGRPPLFPSVHPFFF